MRFCVLSEVEMLQYAKGGDRQYLDLLLSKHEQFLLHHVSKTTETISELLTTRRDCINYVHTHFVVKFNEQDYPNFAMWLLECVIHNVCKEKEKKKLKAKSMRRVRR